jgi:hypothetical protein
MTIKLPKQPDSRLKDIAKALKKYDTAHPDAKIEIKRQNSVSVRIRVIDPGFAHKSRADREEEVWAALQDLPDGTVAEITVLLLLTEEEAAKSFANYDFDHPIPSRL